MGDDKVLRDIKDKKPNDNLVKQLERLLVLAKEGEIRTMVTICDWHDGCVSHGWAYDKRTSARKLLAEMVLLQHNYADDIGFAEGDTVLAKRFADWE